MDSGLDFRTPPVENREAPREDADNNYRLLWDHRWFIANLMLKTAILAVIVSFLLPVKYRSSARFLPSDNSGGSLLAGIAARAMGSTGLDLGDASSLLGGKTSGALYTQIIESRTMQDTIINRFDLRKVYRHRYYKETRKELSKNTKTEEERKSGVITLSVIDKDPARAAQMVDAYLQEISRLSNELNTSAAHNERVFIEQRLVSVKQDLADASKALSEFSTKNATIDISVQGRSMIEGAAALQGQLIAAESELRGLQQIYTPDNIRVKSAQARIAELQRQLDKIGGFKGTNKSPEDASAEDIYPSIKRLPELALRYTELYRRAKMQEAIFTLLTQQYETAKIQEARELPIIKVLDNPDIPEKKDSPSRTLIVLLSTLAAGIGASVWLLIRKKWNNTDDDHPGKRFAVHVANSASRDLHELTRGRFGRRHPESNT
jgi:uncharacterized protein involved in exopolysaccharide biosynthesis